MMPTGKILPHGLPPGGGRAKVALPDHGAACGVKRVNIIRCSNSNNHRPVRPALDVKRLRMDVAHDRAIKA